MAAVYIMLFGWIFLLMMGVPMAFSADVDVQSIGSVLIIVAIGMVIFDVIAVMIAPKQKSQTLSEIIGAPDETIESLAKNSFFNNRNASIELECWKQAIVIYLKQKYPEAADDESFIAEQSKYIADINYNTLWEICMQPDSEWFNGERSKPPIYTELYPIAERLINKKGYLTYEQDLRCQKWRRHRFDK